MRSAIERSGLGHAPWTVAIILLTQMGAVGIGSAARPSDKQLARLRADIYGPSLERAVDAARSLALSGSARGDKLLIGALQMGAPPNLLRALLEALRTRKSAAALDILTHYSGYRDASVRIAALSAVAALRKPEVVDVLIDALDDSDPGVREVGAKLLGARGAQRAERPLLALLRLGDLFAADPLGLVASAETATRLADLVGVLSPQTVAVAFGAMLRRPKFGPDPLRIKVVRALGRLTQIEATTALLEYIASVPPKETRLSKTIAEQLVAGRGL